MGKFNSIILSLIISIISVIGLLLYTVLVISPSYTRLMVESTEEEAQRTGTHLADLLFGKDIEVITTDLDRLASDASDNHL